MLLYRLFIWIYPKAVRLVSLANPKARQWIAGRRYVFEELSARLGQETRPVIWMHVASLGEFEQGVPVLEALKQQYNDHCILLSFFSPSGYEVRKDYPVADHVCYLPMDSPSNAARFVEIVRPRLVIFVKYEFWYYYLKAIHAQQIPLLLVSGIFRANQPFFRWYGGMHRRMLRFFSAIFVQNEASSQLLSRLALPNEVFIGGDTRFDRVLEIASHAKEIRGISDFCGTHPVLVAGSTWTDDDEALDHFANTHPSIRFIIAPHDISEERLLECEKLYRHSIRYSEWRDNPGTGNAQNAHVLLIDNIGMLSRLYQYATLAYVGGGFGDDGIHNILEAAVYGVPVVFGPVYDKYFEATELLDFGGAFSVEDALELEQVLGELFSNETKRAAAAKAAQDYVQMRAGATAQVISFIQAKRLLIS